MMIAGRIENDIGINRNREEEISKRKFKTNRPKGSVGTGRTQAVTDTVNPSQIE